MHLIVLCIFCVITLPDALDFVLPYGLVSHLQVHTPA